MLRSAPAGLTALCAVLAPALYWVGAGVAPEVSAPRAAPAVFEAAPQAAPRAAAVAPAKAASVASIQISRIDGRWHLAVVDADRRQVMERLAVESGSSLFGSDQLPGSLGRVTLNAEGVDAAAAWHQLLDSAPLGFALACDAIRCKVWLATAEAAPADRTLASSKPAAPIRHRRVESTEGEN